ncbi:MAG TPA: class I SAM-dependent rRNA methyltransferase, partial [Isosphaeraceae bacterium]|nr:class I SAM-dependent rRNA methyltransferase [Isosphaeraceae bacterium]
MARPRPARSRSTVKPGKPDAISDVPDRPLDPAGDLPTVSIRTPGHHPFVYKKMVAGPVGPLRPSDGDLVRVLDRDGFPVGFALWNSRSQIALRLIAHGVDAPDSAFWKERLDSAVDVRRNLLKLDDQTDAYRLIHAEADGLSGLVVDRYADVLSAECFSLGMYQRIGPILDLLRQKTGTTHFRVSVDERIALAEDFPGRPVESEGLP